IKQTDSTILSGEETGPHKIQGIGAGFVPGTLDTDIYDEIITIENDESMDTARALGREEGILGGISSGAAVLAGLRVAKELGSDKNGVVVRPSNGERYLSPPLFNFDD